MPRIVKKELHTRFHEMREVGDKFNETKDCAIIAIAAVTGTSYEAVRELMKKHGRKDRKSTPMDIIHNVLKELGYESRYVNPEDFIREYPKPHHKLKNVTSHHPDRFPKVWKNGKTYLIRSSKHILAVINGHVVDWSRNNALRAISILEVWKR